MPADRLLERLQDAQELATHHEARTCCSIVDDEGIERVAIFGSCGEDKSPVVGIGEPEQQGLRKDAAAASGDLTAWLGM
jgi:hypothetical protein